MMTSTKRLSFTGKHRKEQVPYKDFTDPETYDITDPDRPSELSIWERGPKDAEKILYWLANNNGGTEATLVIQDNDHENR